MGKTMRAVVLTEPGPVENLAIRDLPVDDRRDERVTGATESALSDLHG